MRTWTWLAAPLALLPALHVAHASGKVRPKDNSTTKEMSLYIGEISPAQSVATENDFINAWNAPARDEIRKATKNVSDLDQIYELNREAARIWEDLRECNRAGKTDKDAEAATRIAYLQGTLCASGSPRAPEFPRRIAELQNRIESFAATSWIGGNASPAFPSTALKAELPAAHPLFAEILIERLSLRLHAWGTLNMEIMLNAPMPLRNSDRPSDSATADANAVLGEILLLGEMPKSLESDAGGFYSFPAYAIVDVSLKQFRGDGGWRASLNDFQSNLSRTRDVAHEVIEAAQAKSPKAKSPSDAGWDYLNIYHWLALRYGAAKPKSFSQKGWAFVMVDLIPGGALATGVRYKGQEFYGIELITGPVMGARYLVQQFAKVIP